MRDFFTVPFGTPNERPICPMKSSLVQRRREEPPRPTPVPHLPATSPWRDRNCLRALYNVTSTLHLSAPSTRAEPPVVTRLSAHRSSASLHHQVGQSLTVRLKSSRKPKRSPKSRSSSSRRPTLRPRPRAPPLRSSPEASDRSSSRSSGPGQPSLQLGRHGEVHALENLSLGSA